MAQNQIEQRRELAGMVALLQSWFGLADRPARKVNPAHAEPEYKVGEYRVEYTLPTPEEIAEEDPALTDLYNRSKRVSR